MIAMVSDLEVGEFVHVIADAHIYDRHIPVVKEMIDRPTYDAPKFSIKRKVNDFYDFKVEDFELIGYVKNPSIKNIPVAT